MKMEKFMKSKLPGKSVRRYFIQMAAVFLVCTAAGAEERGFPSGSSLSGLSDLLSLFTDASAESGSSSGNASSASADTGSGYLQQILELIGAAGEIPLKEVTVSKIPDQTYTGKELKPVPKLTYNGKTLKRGTDFSLSYRDNVKTGTGKCVITGKGSYKGTKTVSFRIVRSSSSSSKKTSSGTSSTGKASSGKKTTGKFTVKVSAASFEYNGSARKPSVKVTAGGKSVPSSQYTVSYTDNKNVGTASVKVTGKNDYKGYSGTASFKITLKKTTLSGVKCTGEGEVTVTWKKDTQADGYQIESSTYKNFSSNVKKKQITDSKTVSAVIGGCKSGKNCHVRIRAYTKGSGRNTYGPWSTVKSVMVK